MLPKLLRAAAAALALSAAFAVASADDVPKKDDKKEAPAPKGPALTITDTAGKEVKVSSYTITAGVVRVGWLAEPEKAPAPKEDKKDAPPSKAPAKTKRAVRAKAPAEGPECLVIRDETKITFKDGVETLVPLERIRRIDFDAAKSLMTVKVCVDDKPENDLTLVGTTAYKGINKFTVEAEVDKGDLGVATVQYLGGALKGNVKSVVFEKPTPAKSKGARPAVVESAEKGVKKTHVVEDLRAVYRTADGRESASPILHFRKTLKLDVAKIATVEQTDDDIDAPVWKVKTKGGDEASLTLITTPEIDGAKVRLAGLAAVAPAGYKLFPPLRIAAITFDAKEPPKPKEKGKFDDLP